MQAAIILPEVMFLHSKLEKTPSSSSFSFTVGKKYFSGFHVKLFHEDKTLLPGRKATKLFHNFKMLFKKLLRIPLAIL